LVHVNSDDFEFAATD